MIPGYVETLFYGNFSSGYSESRFGEHPSEQGISVVIVSFNSKIDNKRDEIRTNIFPQHSPLPKKNQRMRISKTRSPRKGGGTTDNAV